ncbi:MAG: YihY/virulence factor BrkB family protein [Metamycoplasmataceae bacterium]
MFWNKRKIKASWDAYSNKKEKRERNKWLLDYVYTPPKQNTIVSRFIKILIYFTFLISIKNKHLKNPVKRRKIIDVAYGKLSNSNFLFIPAGLGLYLFLSLIPIFIIVTSIFSLIPGWQDILVKNILQRIIPGFSSLIISFDSDSIVVNTTFILFLLTLIWFSSKGIVKFVDSQSNIYEYNSITNFVIKRLRAILIVFFISLFIVVALSSLIPLIQVLLQNFEEKSLTYEVIFYFLILFFLVIWFYIGIALIFRFTPLFKVSFKQITPGILVTLIPTVIFTMIFGYLTSLIDYSKFGSIGTFLYCIFFVQILSYFLYAGLIINSSYYNAFYFDRVNAKRWYISTKALNWINTFKRRHR